MHAWLHDSMWWTEWLYGSEMSFLLQTQATLTTNDIVINKLTQILLYLRQGMRGKKIKKKDKGAKQ